MKCSNCNKEMIYFKEGQCCGWKCPECGDSLVTTYYSEYEMEGGEFSILVTRNEDSNTVKIKAVSEVLNCNYLQAKAKLTTGFTLSKVPAGDVANIIESFKKAGISFNMTHESPHEA